MNRTIRHTAILTIGLAACVASLPASAAAIVTNTSSSGAFPVDGTDLLTGLSGTVTGTALTGQESTSASTLILTNGAFGIAGTPLDSAQTVAISNNTTITWLLDLLASPTGYDITSISSFTGWRDSGRDRMDYSLFYATVDAPAIFIPITTVAGFNPNPLGGSGQSVVTDDSGLIATGVGQIRWFFPGQENGYVGYRELDVVGFASAAAVPEPGTWAMLAILLGTGTLARRRRQTCS